MKGGGTGNTAGRLPRLEGLQYLRGAAAAAVVAFHAAPVAGLQLPYGAFGVDVFFVLSGFLMMTITDDRSRPLDFLADRVRRVVPLYWCALAATIALAPAGFPAPSLTASHVAASFAFLPHPSEGAPYFSPILNVGWTLNFEMFFYALFALALFLPRRLQLPALTAAFFAVVGLRLSGLPLGAAAFWTNPVCLEFLAGAWASVVWHRRPRTASRTGWLLILAAVPLVVGLYAMTPILMPFYPIVDRAPLLVPALLVLLGVLRLEGSCGHVRRFEIPAVLGDASYSIYLFHRFGIFVAAGLAARLELGAAAAFALAALLGVALGVVVHFLLERPLLVFFKGRRKARLPDTR